MTIPLDGGTGFFDRLGKIGGTMDMVYDHLAAAAIGGQVDEIFDKYLTSNSDVIETLYPALAAYRASPATFLQSLQSIANNTIIQMANDDTPLPSLDKNIALAVLIQQMNVAAESLNRPAVAAGSATYDSTNAGDGAIVASVLNNDGAFQPYVFNENATLLCTSDVASGATQGSEAFSLVTPASVDGLAWNWPTGSGVNSSLTSINPQLDATGGNLLTNGAFDSFTANLPDDWTLSAGVAGTDFVAAGAGDSYDGIDALEFIYNAGTGVPELRQAVTLSAATAYNLRFLMKKSAGLVGAGAIRIALVNSGGTVVNDPQGNACSATFTLSGFTTSYVAKSMVTWTPRIIPTGGLFVSIKISTALADVGESVFVDWGGLNAMTRLYTGGPLVSLWSGITPWEIGDRIVQPFTNDYAGLFVALVDRVYGCRESGLVFPTDAAPTINDNLIS